ncbi:uncharacterized protein K452DRAFT_270184 [Aplosporella prunicola CBS 121167]|uniref:DUF1279 domain-containing protein n=1 Tax=Aplosporella prunicola CBS 121167 TaxID=1176127 RepID=A0A6A6BI20_9PEZI|nr:uncharacterized protein K452DRAFT_270184 [Aplosporella prunicola CBS 121167]KAF2142497.1 hypothetical protein K452DRAFT_270184 [Aplosporella prunicola CBS 121167]
MKPFRRAFFSQASLASASGRVVSNPTPFASRLFRSYLSPSARPRPPLFRPFLRNSSSKRPNPDPTPHLGSPKPALSFSQRMRKLSREYGWVALGVYLGLSVLDFPFCFMAVRMLGVDRIGRWEHAVVGAFWNAVSLVYPEARPAKKERMPEGAAKAEDGAGIVDGALMDVAEADEANSGSQATIWTQLALAYAIHKSFIFLRVPLTAAVTPKIVKVLRGWGWNIGKKKPKSS